jgi:hypothetical protein
MPLVIPKIDSRTYDQWLNEALRRIPVHNPEWTNFNDSDPGVTLLQLFAFMTENLLYRSNLIPERNRMKFLKLLDIPSHPAAAARGMAALSNLLDPPKAVTLEEGEELAAGQTIFTTIDGLDVLPVEARAFYKSQFSEEALSQTPRLADLTRLFEEQFKEEGQTVSLAFYETRPLEAPTSGGPFPAVDLGKDALGNSLWLALLARNEALVEPTREAIANKVLTLGVLPALDEDQLTLLPGGQPSAEGAPNLIFQIPIGETLPAEEKLRLPRYRTLDARPSGDLSVEPGVVELFLPGKDDLRLWDNLEPLEAGVGDFPPSLEDTDLQKRVVTWVRIRLPESKDAPASKLSLRLSWVGVNAARVEQRRRVYNESLGRGSGQPDQTVRLTNTPVMPGSVQLSVDGELWRETDDLYAAGPEVVVRSARAQPAQSAKTYTPADARVFLLDRESGEIRFGDGLHGARPPDGSVILATYDSGGGLQGNVGIGAINKGAALPNGLKVSNPLPTWGGAEPETPAETERRVAATLRHRDRLVSKADYEEITRRTPGVEIGRVEVLSLFHPELPEILSEGVVTVLVIPAYDALHPEAPQPDRLFLNTVCRYLDPRRVITTELHVVGPEYVDIAVSIGFDVISGREVAPVREAVKAAVRQFLSPLYGGIEMKGWPLQKAVERLEIWAAAARVEGVSKVNQVLLAGSDGVDRDRIAMTGLQLPRLAALSAAPGDARPLEEPGLPPSVKVVPIPLTPPECR